MFDYQGMYSQVLSDLFSRDESKLFEVIDHDGLRKTAISVRKTEEHGDKDNFEVIVDWMLLEKWFKFKIK